MGLSGRLQVLVANPSELHVTLLGSMLRPQSPYGSSVPPLGHVLLGIACGPGLPGCWNDAIIPKAPSIVACIREGHAYDPSKSRGPVLGHRDALQEQP